MVKKIDRKTSWQQDNIYTIPLVQWLSILVFHTRDKGSIPLRDGPRGAMVAHLASNQGVAGSSPAGGVK